MSKKTEVMNYMRGRILAGEFQPGEQLPTVNDIAHSFDALGGHIVGGTTVVDAMGALADEGYVFSIQGKAYYMSENLPSSSPNDVLAKAIADLRNEARRLNAVADRLESLT